MLQIPVHIVAARRTPIGRFNGSLAALPAHVLGSAVISACLEQTQVPASAIDEVILGQVLAAGGGMNPARQAALNAGLPVECTAFGVNQVCGSGLRAVALAAQQLRCGDARIIIAGGQEAMSQAPHLLHLRQTRKLGDAAMLDSILHDGLTDALHGCSMGITAQTLATQFNITREAQDAWALQSQQHAAEAQAAGRFSTEIVPLALAHGKAHAELSHDEGIRPDSSSESLARLAPAFSSDGSVTAGNSSTINDGAAALLLMSEQALREHSCISLGRIVSWATVGVEPMQMGLGPAPAARKALQAAGWSVDSVDLWEINEAFAAQILAVLQELELDATRVNVNGGAIALGHPLGASGARVLVSLLHELARRKLQRGVAALCIGGGMGIALCVER